MAFYAVVNILFGGLNAFKMAMRYHLVCLLEFRRELEREYQVVFAWLQLLQLVQQRQLQQPKVDQECRNRLLCSNYPRRLGTRERVFQESLVESRSNLDHNPRRNRNRP